jgi:hypothetical protein
MMVSRELALDEMRQAKLILDKWINELDNPRVVLQGKEEPVYPDGVPDMLSVAEIPSVPVPQLRSELGIAAAKLEAIAST